MRLAYQLPGGVAAEPRRGFPTPPFIGLALRAGGFPTPPFIGLALRAGGFPIPPFSRLGSSERSG